MNSVAVLIATRNRPVALRNLLNSILLSTLRPDQVIIVSSGQNIENAINDYSKILPILHSHTTSIGQIAQKRIGVSLIAEGMTWCVFLDDDLVLEKNTLENAVNAAISYPSAHVIGVGLATPVTSRGVNLPVYLERLLSFFKLSSKLPGTVLSSGHATSYLQSDSMIETQWLNGASMWRAEYARGYGFNLPSTPYAACEDLIFSYPLSKKGTLIFAPNTGVKFQDTQLTYFDDFKVIEAASLWRFYFVSMNKELSHCHFFLSQGIRTIHAMLHSRDPKFTLLIKLVKLNWKMIKVAKAGGSSEELLNELKH